MSNRLPAAGLVALAGILALGCATDTSEDGSSSTGPGEPRVTIIVPVPSSVCDDAKVVSVQARALQIGCEHPPPAPCTMPANPEYVLGDMASCPLSDTAQLGVVVTTPGEYQVDAATDRTPDSPTTECYAESNQQRSLLVTSIDLDVRAVKMDLVGLGMPCPDP